MLLGDKVNKYYYFFSLDLGTRWGCKTSDQLTGEEGKERKMGEEGENEKGRAGNFCVRYL